MNGLLHFLWYICSQSYEYKTSLGTCKLFKMLTKKFAMIILIMKTWPSLPLYLVTVAQGGNNEFHLVIYIGIK